MPKNFYLEKEKMYTFYIITPSFFAFISILRDINNHLPWLKYKRTNWFLYSKTTIIYMAGFEWGQGNVKALNSHVSLCIFSHSIFWIDHFILKQTCEGRELQLCKCDNYIVKWIALPNPINGRSKGLNLEVIKHKYLCRKLW